MRKRDFLLLEAIEAMDARLKVKIRSGAERALALIGSEEPDVAEILGRFGGRRAAAASQRLRLARR